MNDLEVIANNIISCCSETKVFDPSLPVSSHVNQLILFAKLDLIRERTASTRKLVYIGKVHEEVMSIEIPQGVVDILTSYVKLKMLDQII